MNVDLQEGLVTDGYRRAAKSVFANADVPATLLFMVLVDAFGTLEFVNWDPQSVAMQYEADLDDDWGKIPAANRDKVMMLCAVYSSDSFFTDPGVFIDVCNALSGAAVDPNVFDPATVEEMSWAVTEVGLHDITGEFSDDIKAYVGMEAGREGFDGLPGILSWANDPEDEEALVAEDLGADMFAARFRENRDGLREIEKTCEQKMELLMRAVEAFPFRRRDGLSALKPYAGS